MVRMARTDAIVLGAGIVGTSAALQLARRGLSVALIDRRGPGEETSYGNAGVIGGAGVFPTPFPRDFMKVLKVGLKQAPEANYHLSALPKFAPWLFAYFQASSWERLEETARAQRPLMAASVAEHETLAAESGATQYLRKDGWMSLFRSQEGYARMARQFALCEELGQDYVALDTGGAQALEPSLAPVFARAVHWPNIASVSNPLALTRAYAARFAARGGVVLKGDARTLHRSGQNWRVDTAEGPVDAPDAVVTLGPWASDLLKPLGIDLPLAVKRGYHRHYRPRGNAGLTRPIVDAEIGYCLVPMEQGIRLTTGAEFADRDAAPTPVQFDRLMPYATGLFPLGEATEDKTWMGARPCFPDMRPVIGPAPGQPGLWLDYGHNHFGLTLGPITGRLIADLVTGATPFCDPKPFAAERFL
jgi:D-amino-acid dehydrogenase